MVYVVDPDLLGGGGDSPPVTLSFLKLVDTDASSFDPIQEWLLDCDPRGGGETPPLHAMPHPSPLRHGEAAQVLKIASQEQTHLHALSDPSPLERGGAQEPKIGGEEDGCAQKASTESAAETHDGNRVEEESGESGSEDGTSEESESDPGSGGEEEDDDAEDEDDEEEGEIKSPELEELIAGSDDEGGADDGPIKSRNEISGLPPVPPVDVVLAPHHQTLPVGVISSVIGSQVIVDGLANHNPLNEGSILWISETRSPLGLIDEIFGPVKNPYYIVRYNSADEVPSGIHEGTAVSFVAEYSTLILNQDDLRKKGYDASGENDEEIGDEVEFSDDEKEAEYKRLLKQSKRGMANERNFIPDSFTRKKNSSKCSGIEKRESRKGPFREQSTGIPVPQIPTQRQFPSVSGGNDALAASSGFTNSFGTVRPTVPATPQVVQADGCFGGQPSNVLQQQHTWPHGVPIQQHNISVPSVFGVNTPFHHIPQLQQTQPIFLQQQTFPGLPGGVSNGFPFQQQISPNLGAPFNPVPFDQLNSYISPVPMGPMGAANFSQHPYICNNMNAGTVMMPSMNNSGMLFGSSTVPQNVPPMQFHIGASSNMGASSNYGIHHHPPNTRHPFGGHARP